VQQWEGKKIIFLVTVADSGAQVFLDENDIF
jgi:hypothetical protein